MSEGPIVPLARDQSAESPGVSQHCSAALRHHLATLSKRSDIRRRCSQKVLTRQRRLSWGFSDVLLPIGVCGDACFRTCSRWQADQRIIAEFVSRISWVRYD